jgi:hypothetical protein
MSKILLIVKYFLTLDWHFKQKYQDLWIRILTTKILRIQLRKLYLWSVAMTTLSAGGTPTVPTTTWL